MTRKIRIISHLFFTISLLLASVDEAQAKRMGGGSSFGSKPSYSAPYQRSAPSAAPSSQPSRSPAQQQAAAQNQAARQGLASRGGLMGMLGGLALGGLLGSMLFGGAFEGINFMDMLLFAGIGYILYRLFAAKAGQNQPSTANSYARSNHAEPTPSSSSGAGFNTDVMFGKNQAVNQTTYSAPITIPAGFDQSNFLAGAESAFRFLQSAWDKRDLAAIRNLTTDKVFAELQDQLRASSSANKTEVLKLTAELLEVREVGNEQEAVVLFDTIMREDDGDAAQVREVWTFTKPINSKQPKWFLDGIQQLAE